MSKMSYKGINWRGFSMQKLAKEAIKWDQATLQEKISMYKSNPDLRPIYNEMVKDMGDDDILFLLEHLEISLTRLLLRSNEGILASCKPHHANAITRVLNRLTDNQEALKAFIGLNDPSRRETIRHLSSKSRSRVEEALTEYMIGVINAKQRTSKRVRLICTKGLLGYLGEHFYTCASVRCIRDNSIPFEPFISISLDPVNKSCFHLDCPRNGDEGMSLSELPTVLLLRIGSYLPRRYRAWLCLQDKSLHSIFSSQIRNIASEMLLWAAEAGNIDMMKSELEYRPKVDCTDLNGRTPLLLAAQRGDAAMTRLLLEARGVDMYRSDAENISPLSWASRNGHAIVVDLLVAADTEQNLDYIAALAIAKYYGQVEIVEKLHLIAKKKDKNF